MMKVRITIFGNIFLPLIFSICFAQDNTMLFSLVEGNNGKPLGKITGIAQDKQGYMWFGGQGAKCLYRYDGHQVKEFVYDSLNNNSPGSTNLETVYADNDGLIWIGFSGAGDGKANTGGLDQYNPATGIFKHYVNDINDPESISSNFVKVILKDSRGRIWAGTDNGLNRLNPATGKFDRFLHDSSNSRSLSDGFVNSVYEDKNGTIWVGTGYPWFNMAPEKGGLNRLEADGSFTRFMHDPNDSATLINNKVFAILEDSRGVFWVGTSGDGLHTMDRSTGKFTRHRFDPAKPWLLSRPKRTPLDMNDPITFIHEDNLKNIWIGTRTGGLNRYDYNTKKITNYKNSHGFADGSGWNAFNSRDGVLWFSTEEGNLFRCDPARKSFQQNNAVIINKFIEDGYGNVWAGTDGWGLWNYDRHKNLIRKYTADKKSADSLFNNEVISLFFSGDDTLYIGSFFGMGMFNRKKSVFSRIDIDSTVNPGDILPVTDFSGKKPGVFWISRFVPSGTFDGTLIRYHSGKGIERIYKANPLDTNSLSTVSIQLKCVLEDSRGDIWAGAQNFGGISRLLYGRDIFRHYLKGFSIINIIEDKSGDIWAGTDKGLFHLNKKEDRFIAIFDRESVINDALINGLTEDDQNNLWMATSSFIIKVNLKNHQQNIYGKKYGILPNTLIGGIFKKSDGEILVGNKTGFYSFYPAEFETDNIEQKIIITEVLVNNEALKTGKETGNAETIEEITGLKLKYVQNSLAFHFTLTDYREPETDKFFTRLLGHDSSWHETGTEKSVYYYNIAPGFYTFEIKAFDSDGRKVERKLSIVISPPWWSTWWAYVLYAVLASLVLILVFRTTKQRIIQKERHKTQQFELAQAREIEKAYRELKATQTQLIQSEKMASLGELTAGIAHEIQNPLNFVNNFAEINAELIEEAGQAIDNGDTAEAKQLLADLKENEQKISHHGKRADAIVKNMLQHSRSSSGKKEPADINALCDEYLRLAYHGHRAKDKTFNATLYTQFDENTGSINIIAQDIGRVLLNIFNNAFYAVNEKNKTSLPGYEPSVWLHTKRVDDKVVITVKDNGNGIPEKIKDKIFQPFFTTKPTGQGTGLGLSLSYDIVKAHGGELNVNTAGGEGSSFIIILPAENL